MLPVLKEYGVEFVEQPLAPDDLEGIAAVHRRGILPVVVDESCIVAADIPRLAGAVDGINIKLAKCGSLREALRMIATARAQDRKSTRLNSSHSQISYAVFCLKKKKV